MNPIFSVLDQSVFSKIAEVALNTFRMQTSVHQQLKQGIMILSTACFLEVESTNSVSSHANSVIVCLVTGSARTRSIIFVKSV